MSKPQNNKHVTEIAYKKNIKKQSEMNAATLKQLRKQNVTEESVCKLEYFFYGENEQNAASLSKDLIELGYSSSYKKSVGDSTQYVITGWTSKLKMSNANVNKWTEQMCRLGYKYDCDFDGWGTDDF